MQRGLVSCIRLSADPRRNVYSVITAGSDHRIVRVSSGLSIEVGDEVELDQAGQSVARIIGNLGNASKYEKSALKVAKSYIHSPKKSGIKELDSLTEKMQKSIKSAASLMLTKIFLATPAVVRFHNDSDGASGAYGIYLALKELQKGEHAGDMLQISWRMHPGVSYSRGDALEDIMLIRSYKTLSKPLLLLMDFGTTRESNEGIALAEKYFDIIWLDHHPIVDGFKKIEHYISPWLFGGDSNYTAGFLACEFAKSFSNLDMRCIEHASLYGDYSTFYRKENCGSRLSEVLDMITSDKRLATSSGGTNLTPNEIDNIVNDKTKFEELLNFAKSRMSELFDISLKRARNYSTKNADVYVLDFEKVRGDAASRYPLPGRFASKLLARISELSSRPCILALHFGPYISLRSSTNAKGIDLLKLVEKVKKNSSNIESSGGHKEAVSIKLKDESEKSRTIKLIVDTIGAYPPSHTVLDALSQEG
ncbi:MAG: hypothetical protein QXF41_00360 [Candidatus Micrarchaeaceae archaeon]